MRAGIIVNPTDGLQPYPPNQNCKWKITYPQAKFISFSINYLSVAADSDDFLEICDSESNPRISSFFQSNNGNFDSNFKLMSSKAFIEFNSGDPASFESRDGSSVILQVSQAKLNSFFFLYFFCKTKFSQRHDNLGLRNGKKNLYDHHGVIGYPPSTSVSYVEGLSCQWFLHGKQGTLVSLSFTHKRLGFYCYI